jgi:von Willebrand factor type A domain
MSRFDKFGQPKEQIVPKSEGQVTASTETSKVKQYVEREPVRIPDSVARVLSNQPGKFLFCLDATGSMASLIDNAKASLRKIADRIKREAGRPVEIGIVAYRDYDMGDAVEEHSELTADMEALIAFLNRTRANGGGADAGEAVQVALEWALSVDGIKAVLLAGDEPAHSREQLNGINRGNQLTAVELARRFAERKVPIHTFVVGQRPDTVASFEEIAKASGGKRGALDGSATMIDMAVMAMLAALKGTDAVKSYMGQHRLSTNADDFGKLLIEGPKR